MVLYLNRASRAGLVFISHISTPVKAGAYAIQGLFAEFIVKIDGDYNNVVGLPIGRIMRECIF